MIGVTALPIVRPLQSTLDGDGVKLVDCSVLDLGVDDVNVIVITCFDVHHFDLDKHCILFLRK